MGHRASQSRSRTARRGGLTNSGLLHGPRACYFADVPIDPQIRVIRSSIHGYGVIARRDFEPGEVVADVEGIVYQEDELGDDTYCLWVEDGVYFDMVDQTRWINHSCDANAHIEAEVDGKGGAWARVVAYKPIKSGEEITYDYGFPEELAEPCSCGAATCAGWIVDRDELPQLLKRVAQEQQEEQEQAEAAATAAKQSAAPLLRRA
jgi:hypothetical protein